MDNRFINSLVKKCIENRSVVYLSFCLVIHMALLSFFMYINLRPMVLLNIVGTMFYIFLLVLHKETAHVAMLFTYFEIIVFTVITTILLGLNSYFFIYILCAIFAMFFLSKDTGLFRYGYQLFGGAVLLILFFTQKIYEPWFFEYKAIIKPYLFMLSCGNAIITFVSYFFFSFLFAMDVELFTQKLKENNEQLDYSASHDELTGLLNRRSMRSIIQEMKGIRAGVVHVAMLDIDNFKKVNDRYGHEAGDKTLQMVAQCLQESLQSMYISRWGGEEFLVIDLEHSDEEFYSQISRFHKNIQKQQISAQNGRFYVTLTIGLWTGSDMHRIEHYILEADNLLYFGKREHKNSIITQEYMSKMRQFSRWDS